MISLVAALLLSTPSDFQKGLLGDLDVLRQAYTEMHPGLYRYNTPQETEEHFRQLQNRFLKAKNLQEAYVALSLFTASVRCGHTYPNFFNQNKPVVQDLFSGQNRVPFHFRWLGGKMVVTADLTPNHALPPGTEISAIDGIACSTILARMMQIARADGHNDAKRLSILEVGGKDKYEAFDIYLPLMFPIPPGKLRISARGTTMTVNALTMEDRIKDCAAQEAAVSASGDRWRLEFPSPNVGRLVMPSWVMYDNSWEWKGYLAKTFDQLDQSQANSLIIDLRGNEGGSAVGDELLAYLISKPTNFDQYKLYTRYTKVSPALRPYLDTWDRSFDDWSQWSAPAQYVEAGHNLFHRMNRFDDIDRTLVQPKPTRFKGRVFVLVDSSNSSATFEFENMVQTCHLAKLVGEPTGGSQRGINGSAFYFLYLPFSKLEVDLPLVAQFPDREMPDKGLTPDVVVHPAAADLAAGRDAVLERALQLAEAAPGTP